MSFLPVPRHAGVWRLTVLLQDFLRKETASGFVLMGCAALSLLLANSPLGHDYLEIWHAKLFGESVEYWINDGLMTIFFLLVGLEIEREVYIGELASPRAALLPVLAALGGMLVPALIHLGLNYGTPTQGGAGIPMATDIAFALGVLMLLGDRVPVTLKIFLTALAIIDDLGAIVVIATAYSHGLSWGWLAAAGGIFLMLAVLNRRGVATLLPYLALGVAAWFCMLHSGVHATITGVVLAFLIPFRQGGESSPSYRLQHALHKPVAFVILPLFALANTGIAIPEDWAASLATANSLGIMAGLLIGKPLGIVLFSLLALRLGCDAPPDLTRRHLLGAGLLGGIGFTMSVFITLLAFDDPAVIVASKMAIMLASVAAGLAGMVWLRWGAAKG